MDEKEDETFGVSTSSVDNIPQFTNNNRYKISGNVLSFL